MNGYMDRDRSDIVSTVCAGPGDPGTADITVTLKAGRWGEHTVDMNSRVSREDLPKLVQDLYNCVAPELRATLLDCLKDLG
jgi:hypothetical protein